MERTIKGAAKSNQNFTPEVIDFADKAYEKKRVELRKADMQWQMNLAKKVLFELNTDKPQTHDSLQSFHNMARKRLWYLRRRRSA